MRASRYYKIHPPGDDPLGHETVGELAQVDRFVFE